MSLYYPELTRESDPWTLDDSEPVTAAVTWAAWGLPVYPTRERGLPWLKPTEQGGGHKQASDDLDVVVSRWERRPQANIHAALPSSVVAIDIDQHGHDDGWSEITELESEIGELPETVTILTPRGGAHLIFRVDCDTHAGRWSQYAAGCRGVELLRFNTPLPPSARDDGPYRLVRALPSLDAVPALPDAWLRLFRRVERITNPWSQSQQVRGGSRLQADLLAEIGQAGEGTRNATLFQKACTAIKYSVFDAELFTDAGRSIGLTDAEISACLRSAEQRVIR